MPTIKNQTYVGPVITPVPPMPRWGYRDDAKNPNPPFRPDLNDSKLLKLTAQYTVAGPDGQKKEYPAREYSVVWSAGEDRFTSSVWKIEADSVDDAIAGAKMLAKKDPGDSRPGDSLDAKYIYPPRSLAESGHWEGGDKVPRNPTYALVRDDASDLWYSAPVYVSRDVGGVRSLLELEPHAGTGPAYSRTLKLEGSKRMVALVNGDTVVPFTDGRANLADSGRLLQPRRWVPDPTPDPNGAGFDFISGALVGPRHIVQSRIAENKGRGYEY